jgi:hypothetical protein
MWRSRREWTRRVILCAIEEIEEVIPRNRPPTPGLQEEGDQPGNPNRIRHVEGWRWNGDAGLDGASCPRR